MAALFTFRAYYEPANTPNQYGQAFETFWLPMGPGRRRSPATPNRVDVLESQSADPLVKRSSVTQGTHRPSWLFVRSGAF